MILACHYAHEDGFQMVSAFKDKEAMEEHFESFAVRGTPRLILETETIRKEDYDRWRAARITVHGFDDLT